VARNAEFTSHFYMRRVSGCMLGGESISTSLGINRNQESWILMIGEVRSNLIGNEACFN